MKFRCSLMTELLFCPPAEGLENRDRVVLDEFCCVDVMVIRLADPVVALRGVLAGWRVALEGREIKPARCFAHEGCRGTGLAYETSVQKSAPSSGKGGARRSSSTCLWLQDAGALRFGSTKSGCAVIVGWVEEQSVGHSICLSRCSSAAGAFGALKIAFGARPARGSGRRGSTE